MAEQEARVIRKSVVVEVPAAEAFRVFTEEIATWWPAGTHSVGRDRVEAVVLEGRVGGRFYERMRDGAEIDWGEVTLWEPPRRLSYTWHPGRSPDTGQQVDMRFHPRGDRTLVELHHRGWERLGADADEAVASYDEGWDLVLRDRYAAAARPSYAGGAAGARSGT